MKRRSLLHYAIAAVGVLALLAGLALVPVFYKAHQPVFAGGMIVVLGIAVWIYTSARAYAYRYVVPGVLAVIVFIVFPMAYTLGISFTNYSSQHLLSRERATDVLLQKKIAGDASMNLKLFRVGDKYQLFFSSDDEGAPSYTSEPFAFPSGHDEQHVKLQTTTAEGVTGGQIVLLKDMFKLQPSLKQIAAVLPDGTELRQSSLRRFAQSKPAFKLQKDGSLVGTDDGHVLKPNVHTGFFEDAAGKPIEPGFRTTVGWQNYWRVFTDPTFHQPFLRIFTWTVAFASLNTLATFAIGIVLAVLLNWEALEFRGAYRMMLFLPYAVPAFISIPVFKGLFNENLGEINAAINLIFGSRPAWFSDPNLARSMVLLVNTWLGYPYMMILCMGLIKAIPDELYEASALAGAGPITNFFSITLPLILRPIAPLLIASFAFNFNNLTLIALLTSGGPDFLDTQVPAGATDLLVSYTYRIAFQDSGQNYALASAISSIVFLIVATLAVVNLRLFKVNRAS
ncbi:maltose ABC transporter permease MalF [Amantichitinum ursilacus]|uniref:Maltose/maltodextrin transport system permease protein n=1 Tax=Amantichitinum ursilacus TaxID=857265 RepID=A0A0N1JRV4_9NEIS|nr:maltose ABC transporter permease MalF [Amantichitinum ursilacus]KPC50640.1 Maltose transport system permease protein MalF [Amantichitinum ursilacus]